VQETAARFALLGLPAGHIEEGTAAERAALADLCRRPELRPLLMGQHLRIGDQGGPPFRVADAGEIQLDPRVLTQPALGLHQLRHALEIAFLHRIRPNADDPAYRLALAILAAHVALVHVENRAPPDREHVLSAGPRWLTAAAGLDEALRSGGNRADSASDEAARRSLRVSALARHWADLLPLQGDDTRSFRPSQSTLDRACRLALAALPLAVPTECGLDRGGDSRLLVDPTRRLNGYGCSAAPRPWAITFCSCTASSTSELGFNEAELGRQSLLQATLASDAPASAFEVATEEARSELAAFLGLGGVPGSEIVFCSSGTDCELFALHFVLAVQARPVLNILIAPDEIGSGSTPAARGAHFDRLAPLGRSIEPGAAIDGFATDRVRVTSIALRDADGNLVPLPQLDRQVETVCADAHGRGESVLLHLLDSSKTGVRAPSFAAAARLRAALSDRVFVVVDAAQMRIDPAGLVACLERGFMVMISGSKFYTGTPFSGALLVPPALARAIAILPGLPSGLADYASRFEMPPRWQLLRAGLGAVPNVGLFLRWQTALWEMRAFAAVSSDVSRRCFEAFAAPMREAIAQCPHAELIDAPVGDRTSDGLPARWDGVQTIYTFLVHRVDGATGTRTPLGYEEARAVYFWLNTDLSAVLPADASGTDRMLAARCCHIGQPVRIRRSKGPVLGALRIAVGARYVTRVQFDPTLGPDCDARIAAQIADVDVVLRKIGLILAYWQALSDSPHCRP
jgi:hypothetical protein